jgi:hypothetical protein
MRRRDLLTLSPVAVAVIASQLRTHCFEKGTDVSVLETKKNGRGFSR